MKMDLRAHRCHTVQIRFIWRVAVWRRGYWEAVLDVGEFDAGAA
jgi:hypothetical protein